MIPLESLAVIAASYTAFMLLDYATFRHLRRKTIWAGLATEDNPTPSLKLRVNMVENVVWAVMAWLIGWWVIPLYYATMYPLRLLFRLLARLVIFVIEVVVETDFWKDQPLEKRAEAEAGLVRIKKLRKTRKVPMRFKVMWLVLLSASVAVHLYLPFSFAQ